MKYICSKCNIRIDVSTKKAKCGNVTLLYAAKNEDVNHAIVLKEWIEDIKQRKI